MGYGNFLPYWAMAMTVIPLVATIMVPGTVGSRMRILGWTSLLASGLAVGGIVVGFASVFTGFMPGIVFAIYGTPPACAIAAALLVRSRAPRWRDWPARRLDRFEQLLYAWLVVSTVICVVLIPGPFASGQSWIGIDPTMSRAWGAAIALLGLVAMDLLPSAPRAGFTLGALFYLVQAFGYASFTGLDGGWHLGNGILDYCIYLGDGRFSAWIDLVAVGLALAHAIAAIRRRAP